MRTVVDLIDRLRAEYLEMPGLSLTHAQIERLCGIERKMCQVVLDTLIARKFLRLTPDGRYTRLGDGDATRPRPAHADLKTDLRSRKEIGRASCRERV